MITTNVHTWIWIYYYNTIKHILETDSFLLPHIALDIGYKKLSASVLLTHFIICTYIIYGKQCYEQ